MKFRPTSLFLSIFIHPLTHISCFPLSLLSKNNSVSLNSYFFSFIPTPTFLPSPVPFPPDKVLKIFLLRFLTYYVLPLMTLHFENTIYTIFIFLLSFSLIPQQNMSTSLFPKFINHSRSFQSLYSLEAPIPLTNLPSLPAPQPTSLVIHQKEPVQVPNQFLCPNIRCDITGPHLYMIPPHPIPPSDVPHVQLSRFTTIPFPGSNVWTVEDEPPFLFRYRHTIYAEYYGVLSLEKIGIHTRKDRKWAVYSGNEPDRGPRLALIYVPLEWTLLPLPDSSASPFSFLTRFFSCFSGYSC
jgi:hypothetical protein